VTKVLQVSNCRCNYHRGFDNVDILGNFVPLNMFVYICLVWWQCTVVQCRVKYCWSVSWILLCCLQRFLLISIYASLLCIYISANSGDTILYTRFLYQSTARHITSCDISCHCFSLSMSIEYCIIHLLMFYTPVQGLTYVYSSMNWNCSQAWNSVDGMPIS